MAVLIDAARVALVIVDLQNGFCPGGALGVHDGHLVVPVLNRYAERFAARGAAIFASRDWHPAKTTHFQPYGGVWPPHCLQGTPGADFHPDLVLPPEAEIVSKGMDPESDAYSCFQAETPDGLPFAALLGERGVSRLFIGGLATDYCVRSTVVDGVQAGFEVVVLEDAVAAVDVAPGDGDKALAEMRAAGARLIRLADLA